jgi:hypothetical protein
MAKKRTKSATQPEHRARPKEFPPSHGVIGDVVWYREALRGEWQRSWEIKRVGLLNDSDLPNDIEIVNGQLETKQVSPFDFQRVLIIPPVIPDKLLTMIRKYHNLIVVRTPRNAPNDTLQLFCSDCKWPLHVEDLTINHSGVTWDAESGAFSESKPYIVKGNRDMVCKCGLFYDIPFVDYS